jgi:hypothetical protein
MTNSNYETKILVTTIAEIPLSGGVGVGYNRNNKTKATNNSKSRKTPSPVFRGRLRRGKNSPP